MNAPIDTGSKRYVVANADIGRADTRPQRSTGRPGAKSSQRRAPGSRRPGSLVRARDHLKISPGESQMLSHERARHPPPTSRPPQPRLPHPQRGRRLRRRQQQHPHSPAPHAHHTIRTPTPGTWFLTCYAATRRHHHPHSLHPVEPSHLTYQNSEKPAPRGHANPTRYPPVTTTLGVKGSQVRILSARRPSDARRSWIYSQVGGRFDLYGPAWC